MKCYSVKQVTKQIEMAEKFPVAFVHDSGRRVRSDRANMIPYGFKKAIQNMTIASWKKQRIDMLYEGLEFHVAVLNPDGDEYGDRTMLNTVRRDWED
jgi:hypothetical protein